jgi:hypothetical protein
MKKTNAQINIRIDVECPNCEDDLDLLDKQQFPNLNDDGYL